jgi:hypothetical protein
MTNEELDKKIAELQHLEFVECSLKDKTMLIAVGYGEYSPSTNWQQAGELVEKYKVELFNHIEDGSWSAYARGQTVGEGGRADTPQRAICLAVLALEGEK